MWHVYLPAGHAIVSFCKPLIQADNERDYLTSTMPKTNNLIPIQLYIYIQYNVIIKL